MLAGQISDVLYGASLVPNLVSLDLSGNAFTGTLPPGLTMPNLQYLSLTDNYIQVGTTRLSAYNFNTSSFTDDCVFIVCSLEFT